ncbi:hypothetical protein, partial [Heyndrickxia sporothermodurans]|uniref:hypothetical protein n=1 Tax=Heyndrickxia sporothermodurans TaxID=46224 RepID=UPI001F3DBB86
YMRCLNGGLLVNYHYTRFGEVLLFLSLKPLDTQGLRIMKFIHMKKDILEINKKIIKESFDTFFKIISTPIIMDFPVLNYNKEHN